MEAQLVHVPLVVLPVPGSHASSDCLPPTLLVPPHGTPCRAHTLSVPTPPSSCLHVGLCCRLQEEVEELTESLDVRGTREHALFEMLSDLMEQFTAAMPKRPKGMVSSCGVACVCHVMPCHAMHSWKRFDGANLSKVVRGRDVCVRGGG